jgi:hypothetical protein
VLSRLATLTVSRLAAAAVAVLLTGGLRVAAQAAPLPGHVCRCHHQGADDPCDCPRCHAAAPRPPEPAPAEDESLPPCHRAAALKARQAAERPAPPREAPCVQGTCGDDPVAATLLGVDPFTPPVPPDLPGSSQAGPAWPEARQLAGWTRALDPPPPR